MHDNNWLYDRKSKRFCQEEKTLEKVSECFLAIPFRSNEEYVRKLIECILYHSMLKRLPFVSTYFILFRTRDL